MKHRIPLFLFCLLMSGFCFLASAAWAACTSPAGSAGDTIYSSAYHVPQYCDGSKWWQMGQQGAGGSGCVGAPSSGLVGYWKFDEGTGTTTADSSGNGNTGTLYTFSGSGPTWTTGILGDALTFNWQTSQPLVQVTDAPSLRLSGSWTVSAWVNMAALPTSGQATRLVERNDISGSANYALVIDNAAIAWPTTGVGWMVDFQPESSSSNIYTKYVTAISTGTWYHVAGVYDSVAQTETLYLNGSAVASSSTTGNTPGSGNGGLNIGDFTSATGTLDDVRIYNRALSAAEVLQLYYFTGPTGGEGDIMYNAASHVPQFCDGTRWIAMGPNASGASSSGGLVGWWKLDDGAGTSAADSSGTGNTGTLTNGPTWTTSGVNNGALTFNGTTQYVNVPDAASLRLGASGGSFTVSAWINLTSLPASGAVYALVNKDNVGTNSNYELIVDNGLLGAGLGWVVLFDDTSTDHYTKYVTSITAGTWYHLAGVWDGTTKNLYLYLNSQLVGTQSFPGIDPWSPTGNPLIIAAQNGGASYLTNGTLDDVRIYNRALGADEIKALMAADDKNGLVGWWKLDETSGTTATDSSGNGNNGTYVNSPTPIAGIINNALDFSGDTGSLATNDVVNVGDPANGSLDFGLGSFSYGMWVYATSGAAAFTVPFYKGGTSSAYPGYEIELDSTSWKAYVNDGTVNQKITFAGAPILNQWVHLFAVVDRSANLYKAYLNGVLVGSQSIATIGTLSNASSLAIGASGNPAGQGQYPFQGHIDDVRVYSRALSDGEVAALYYNTAGPKMSAEGDMLYNSGINRMQYFNGNNWVVLGH